MVTETQSPKKSTSCMGSQKSFSKKFNNLIGLERTTSLIGSPKKKSFKKLTSLIAPEKNLQIKSKV